MARSPSDPSTVFAAGDRVWKSADGGMHWAPYGKRMIRLHVSDLEVGPGPVDNVLIVASGDVYRSTAGGPWERSTGLGEPEFHPADLARGNANPNLMLAMTAFGVIGPGRSATSWRPTDPPTADGNGCPGRTSAGAAPSRRRHRPFRTTTRSSRCIRRRR